MTVVVLIFNYSNCDLNVKFFEIKNNLKEHKPILEVDSPVELDEIEEPDDTPEIVKDNLIYSSNFSRETENPQNIAEISENAVDIIFEYDDYPDYIDYTDNPGDENTIRNFTPNNEVDYISETETTNPFILPKNNESNINPYIIPIYIPLYNESTTDL